MNHPLTFLPENSQTESDQKKKDVLVHILLNPTSTEEMMESWQKNQGKDEGKIIRMIFLMSQ